MVSSITSASTTLTDLQTLLKAADTNGDGIVSAEELQASLSDSDTAAALVSAADSDGDGAMSLQEFSSFATQFDGATGMVLIAAQEDSGVSAGLAEMFAKLDSDGDATLTGDEIAQSVASLQEQAAEDEAAAEAEAERQSESVVTTVGAADTDDDYVVSDDIQDLIDSVDTNQDGVFDSKDIAALILDADDSAGDDDDETSVTEDLLQTVYGSDADDEETT